MNRTSINDATKEQLIDIVRQLRKQVKEAKAAAGRPDGSDVEELQRQVAGFQGLLQEKNDEVQALRMQCRMLSEKCANDESTISTLLARLEEMQDNGHALKSDKMTRPTSANSSPKLVAFPTPDVGRKGAGAAVPDGSVPPLGLPSAEKDNSIVSSLRSQLAASVATVAAKAEEMVKLETQVRELMEVNSFYSAIVSQHDQEEKERGAAESSEGQKKRESSGDHVTPSELLRRLSRLEDDREQLQHVIRQAEREKTTLATQNSTLIQELERVNGELLEIGRRQRIQGWPAGTAVAPTHEYRGAQFPGSTNGSSASFGDGTSTTERVAAMMVAQPIRSVPASAERRGLRFSPLATSSTIRHAYAAQSAADMRGDGGTMGAHGTTALNEIRALKPIHIRNPDPQEKQLLERVALYERYVQETEAFETARQKSFSEMEQARAELFVRMERQIAQQLHEIQQLKKAPTVAPEGVSARCLTDVATAVPLQGAFPSSASADGEDQGRLEPGQIRGSEALQPTQTVTDARMSDRAYEVAEDTLLRSEEKSRYALQLATLSEYIDLCLYHFGVIMDTASHSFPSLQGDHSSLHRADEGTQTSEVHHDPSADHARQEENSHPGSECRVDDAVGQEDSILAPSEMVSGAMDSFEAASENKHYSNALNTLFDMYGESLEAMARSLQVAASIEGTQNAQEVDATLGAVLSKLRESGRLAATDKFDMNGYAHSMEVDTAVPPQSIDPPEDVLSGVPGGLIADEVDGGKLPHVESNEGSTDGDERRSDNTGNPDYIPSVLTNTEKHPPSNDGGSLGDEGEPRGSDTLETAPADDVGRGITDDMPQVRQHDPDRSCEADMHEECDGGDNEGRVEALRDRETNPTTSQRGSGDTDGDSDEDEIQLELYEEAEEMECTSDVEVSPEEEAEMLRQLENALAGEPADNQTSDHPDDAKTVSSSSDQQPLDHVNQSGVPSSRNSRVSSGSSSSSTPVLTTPDVVADDKAMSTSTASRRTELYPGDNGVCVSNGPPPITSSVDDLMTAHQWEASKEHIEDGGASVDEQSERRWMKHVETSEGFEDAAFSSSIHHNGGTTTLTSFTGQNDDIRSLHRSGDGTTYQQQDQGKFLDVHPQSGFADQPGHSVQPDPYSASTEAHVNSISLSQSHPVAPAPPTEQPTSGDHAFHGESHSCDDDDDDDDFQADFNPFS